MAEFAESILYIPLRGDLSDKREAKANLEPRFQDGIFLGLTDRSDEIVVWSMTEGIRKARTIRRRPEGEMWRKDELLSVRGTPLLPNPGRDDSRIMTKMIPGLANTDVIGDPITKQEVAREMGEKRLFYLLKDTVREAAKVIGYTKGCVGCRSVEMGFK